MYCNARVRTLYNKQKDKGELALDFVRVAFIINIICIVYICTYPNNICKYIRICVAYTHKYLLKKIFYIAMLYRFKTDLTQSIIIYP